MPGSMSPPGGSVHRYGQLLRDERRDTTGRFEERLAGSGSSSKNPAEAAETP